MIRNVGNIVKPPCFGFAWHFFLAFPDHLIFVLSTQRAKVLHNTKLIFISFDKQYILNWNSLQKKITKLQKQNYIFMTSEWMLRVAQWVQSLFIVAFHSLQDFFGLNFWCNPVLYTLHSWSTSYFLKHEFQNFICCKKYSYFND